MMVAIFATLGPVGSNHDLVLQSYLAREGIAAETLLCADFQTVLEACANGCANRILLCAAHGDCGHVVGTAQYKLGLTISDVFISGSQPLAILHRTDSPRSIALHPATRDYADLGAYEEVIEAASTVAAAEGLMAGRWRAALTAARFAKEGIRIVRQIHPPRDAWLVIGGEDRRPVLDLP